MVLMGDTKHSILAIKEDGPKQRLNLMKAYLITKKLKYKSYSSLVGT